MPPIKGVILITLCELCLLNEVLSILKLIENTHYLGQLAAKFSLHPLDLGSKILHIP